MQESGLQILADNVISKSLKTINLAGTMGQHLPVLVKIIYIIDAFKI